MTKEFFERCKKNDKGLRTALGKDRRAVTLGQYELEEQDFYLVALDRNFLANINNTRGFLLTVNKDESDVVFNVYQDYYEDMYNIGHFKLSRDAEAIEQNLKTIDIIENKMNSLTNEDRIRIDDLNLTEEEQWFENYISENRWTFEDVLYYEKRELQTAIFCYKAINSIIKEYNLVNNNNANV